ncbi:MAG: 50S ribosomal protein L18 [Candidatus Dadabacteria bacterium]|nr:MAG: 50S ribosomal protein L18 [Candidatus Dadabacteria bacterium]
MDRRKRSKYRIRKKISGTPDRPRVSVYKSCRYTYAQVIDDVGGKVLLGRSTKEEEVRKVMEEVISGKESEEAGGFKSASTKSRAAAKALGILIGRKCKEKGIEKVVFDRNGYIYHGRVKEVAEGLREAGVKV